jgi:cell wall-associated NlpC family hydrolase
MIMKKLAILYGTSLLLSSCIYVVRDNKEEGEIVSADSSHAYALPVDTMLAPTPATPPAKDSTVAGFFSGKEIDTRKVRPEEVVAFAKTLIGTPYKYASTDPKAGFDCSGFITYVFHHFDIVVPRSSIDFTEVGKPVSTEAAKPGDLVLFTGTDSTEHFVGHMGLVVSNDAAGLQFIHSSSGKKYGVTISPLDGYYRTRYMKTIRIF